MDEITLSLSRGSAELASIRNYLCVVHNYIYFMYGNTYLYLYYHPNPIIVNIRYLRGQHQPDNICVYIIARGFTLTPNHAHSDDVTPGVKGERRTKSY